MSDFLIVTLRIVMFYLAIFLGSAQAQTGETVPPSHVHALTGKFEKDFGQIAKEQKLLFICEGVPFARKLSDVSIHSVIAPSKRLSLRETVDAVAQAYDYDCEWKSNRVVLLRKRFTNEDDLPDVSYQEVRRCLESIVTLWQPYGRREMDSETAGSIMGTLSSDFREELANGFVPVSDLPEPFRSHIQAMLWESISAPVTRTARTLVFRLKQCSKPGTVTFMQKDLFRIGVKIPIYTGKLYRYKGMQWDIDVPVTSVAYTQSGVNAIVPFSMKGNSSPDDTKAYMATLLATDPILKRKIVGKLPPTWSVNLGDYVRTLSDPASTKPFVCDPDLSQKRLCVFGDNQGSPTDILGYLADLFDLRIVTTKDKQILTLRSFRRSDIPESLAQQTVHLLPLSVRQYVWGDSAGTPPAEARTPAVNRWQILYRASMVPLRAIADKQIQASPDGKVLLEAMPDQTRDLIALSSLTAFFEQGMGSALRQSIPAPLLHFEESTIHMTVPTTSPGQEPFVTFNLRWNNNDYSGFLQ